MGPVDAGVQSGAEPMVGALDTGHEVCRYRVERVLGRGGMATVYLVHHSTLSTLHALKVLDISSALVRERLLLEGRVQARLRHPNLVSVTDVLDVHGAPGLLMEYVEGPSLDAWIHGNQPDLQTASQMFCGILSAMEQAHALGYVHRDLKPANVLLKRDIGRWVPKVTDFGIAKVIHREHQGHQTQAGFPVGTPSFMAPEQVSQAQSVDERADIFSLGCILYQLVTHQQAFPGDNMLEIFNASSRGDYRDPAELVPELPGALAQGIRGALEPDREARIPDCGTLRMVLSGQQPWGAETTSPPNFQLPACSVVPMLQEDDPTEPDLYAPAVPAALERGLVLPQQPEGDADGPFVSGPTLTMEAFEAAEQMQRGRVRRVAVISALASAAAMGLVWLLVGSLGGEPAGVEHESEPQAPVLAAEAVEITSSPELAPELEVLRTVPEPEPTPAARPAPIDRPTASAPQVATAPSSGTVQVSGDHTAALLVDSAGEAHTPGTLPPGTYDLQVRFPSGRSIERVRFLEVDAGRSYQVRCSALMENCR
jgi:eukaryotic-like serine/threonine-protein kinase